MNHNLDNIVKTLEEVGVDSPLTYIYFSVIRKLKSDFGSEAVEEFKSVYEQY